MKWYMNEHAMFKEKTFQLGFFSYAFLHVCFEELKLISRPRFLHESCIILSLVSNGSSFSFISFMKRELWSM